MIFISSYDDSDSSCFQNSLLQPAKETMIETQSNSTSRMPYTSDKCKFISKMKKFDHPSSLLLKRGLDTDMRIESVDRGHNMTPDIHSPGNAQMSSTSMLASPEKITSRLAIESPHLSVQTNTMVKVKLGYLKPVDADMMDSGPFSENTEGCDDDEEFQEMNFGESACSRATKGKTRKKTVKTNTKISNASSKAHFTIGSYCSQSARTIKTQQIGSVISHGQEDERHRIDTVIDVEAILAKNEDLNEYIRQKHENEANRKKAKTTGMKTRTLTFGGRMDFTNTFGNTSILHDQKIRR